MHEVTANGGRGKTSSSGQFSHKVVVLHLTHSTSSHEHMSPGERRKPRQVTCFLFLFFILFYFSHHYKCDSFPLGFSFSSPCCDHIVIVVGVKAVLWFNRTDAFLVLWGFQSKLCTAESWVGEQPPGDVSGEEMGRSLKPDPVQNVYQRLPRWKDVVSSEHRLSFCLQLLCRWIMHESENLLEGSLGYLWRAVETGKDIAPLWEKGSCSPYVWPRKGLRWRRRACGLQASVWVRTTGLLKPQEEEWERNTNP